MDKQSKRERAIIALLLILFSPLLIAAMIFVGIATLIEIPKNKKIYKASRYYEDLGLPFSSGVVHSREYRFYNSAVKRGLPIKYVRQESNGFEYFVYDGAIYLFPGFDGLDYFEEEQEWRADFDGDWVDFDESYEKLLKKLDGDAPALPVRLLVERVMIYPDDLTVTKPSECIYVTWGYESAFEDDDSPLIMTYPTTSAELYRMMSETPGLCGKYELGEDGSIRWDLYDGYTVTLSIDLPDCCIGISKADAKIPTSITHWHPTAFKMYNEVRRLGMSGSVLVIRTFMGGASMLYCGRKDECPYSPDKRHGIGKIHFLEAR